MPNFWSKDKGLDSLLREFKVNSGEDFVKVGFLHEKKHKDSKLTVAEVAMYNEFGTATIPERSFFRSTMARISKKLVKMCRTESLKILRGQTTKNTSLGIIGEYAVTAIKDTIQSNVPPPNAPGTVKAKGSDHTLIDTGQTRDDVDYEIRKGKK